MTNKLSNSNHSPAYKSTSYNHFPVQNFNHHQYPFPNKTSGQPVAFKTILSVTLDPFKLQKVVRLNHPNIIGIRKIVKSSLHQKEDLNCQALYTFYYQVVHFSLLALSQKPESNPRLSNLLLASDLVAVLQSVVSCLQQLGIYYTPQLQDVGISLEGNLKLFVSPLVIFQSKYQTGVQRSLREIADWWDNRLRQRNSTLFKKQKKNQPSSLPATNCIEFQDPNVPDTILEKQLGDLLAQEQTIKQQPNVPTNPSMNPRSKIGNFQKQKIKLIDQQVKYIRERLNQKESKVYPSRNQANRQGSKDKQGDKPQSKEAKNTKQQIPQANYFRQPIQQNINCINIYNHNNHIPPPRPITTIPRYMASQPRISPNYFDPHFIKEHQEDQDSQDTYDIEFQQAFDNLDPNKHKLENKRELGRERQLSEYSVQVPKKKKEDLEKDTKKINRVCNKNYTQSAGPLQFKSLMSRFLQLEDKRVNQEDQLAKRTGEDSKRESNISTSNYTPQSIRSASIDHTIKQPVLVRCNEERTQKAHGGQITRIRSQNELVGFRELQGGKQSEIEERVKRALQKTKNAIALLNRVKSNKTLPKK